MTIQTCQKCLMPSSRPRVVFDDHGVCNACRWAEIKPTLNWAGRRKELLALAEEAKASNAPWTCVVPFSGGKDSAAVAWKLREVGFRPLLVCYGQLLWTDVGRRNLHRVADAGFDILYWRVNQRVSRLLARRFFIERGHPKQHYDAAVNAVPLITADAFGIPLVFFAEHGETEYGGLVLSENSRRERDRQEVLEHQIGDDPRNWATDGISEHDLAPYIPPERHNCKVLYFSYFEKWSIYDNMKLAKEKFGFEGNGYTVGSFEDWDSIDDMMDDLDIFMMHVKFGFGRATRMASRLIQLGVMTRDEALPLVRQHDGAFPSRYMPETLEYLGLTGAEFTEIVDTHRNDEIWKREGGEWLLRNPIA